MTYPLPSPALKEFLATLRHGEARSGVVTAIETFGLFVDLDGAPEPSVGFIPPPEVSWKWISSCGEVVTIGQRVTALVLGVDAEMRGQAVLSLISLQPNPWMAWADKVGSVLQGRVTKLVPFGVFVSVDDGIDGLLDNSKLSQLGSNHDIRVGGELTARIAEVDPARRRIRLSLLTEHAAADGHRGPPGPSAGQRLRNYVAAALGNYVIVHTCLPAACRRWRSARCCSRRSGSGRIRVSPRRCGRRGGPHGRRWEVSLARWPMPVRGQNGGFSR